MILKGGKVQDAGVGSGIHRVDLRDRAERDSTYRQIGTFQLLVIIVLHRIMNGSELLGDRGPRGSTYKSVQHRGKKDGSRNFIGGN